MALVTQVCVMLCPSFASRTRLRAYAVPGPAGATPQPPPAQTLCLPFLADKRAFFIICTSELGPPQIYELVALTSSDKNT